MKLQHYHRSIIGISISLLLVISSSSSGRSASVRDVVISEIAWMGTKTSHTDEWIELYNNTGSPIDLSGWTLNAADGTPSISLTGTVPAGGYYLLERSDDSPVPGVAADEIYTGDLGNEGEDLALRDSLSTIIDRVDCSVAGWFSGHNEVKVPMVRKNTTADGSDKSNWTFNPRCGDPTNRFGDSYNCSPPVEPIPGLFKYSVYFDERTTTASDITLEHTIMEDALLSQIAQASTSIDVALYELNRQSVVDALIAAHNASVIVRVVGDDDAAASSGSGPFYQQLIAAGIPVITDDSPSIQHNKFMVFDDQTVWTGSVNFTDRGLSLNAENAMVITDATLADIYATEFEEMWSRKFHKEKEDNTKHVLSFDDALVESYYSPTDLTAFEVWSELANADETIHFAMNKWTDEILSDRAVERLEAGVQVWGAWDELGVTDKYSQYQKLCDAGATLGIEKLPATLHDKFAVIDVNGSDPTVITGSYNWTDGGAYENDENMLVIHNQAIAQAYYDEWKRLWGIITVDRICNPLQQYLPVIVKR